MATEAEHETLLPPVHVDLEWVGEQKFTGGRPDAPSTTIDGKRTVAPSPVDTLVLSLIACSAIDVLHVLEKRRTPARSLNMSADFARVDGFPKRLKTVQLTFKVDTDSSIGQVERAVSLSLEKYCSVAGSLAPDIEIATRVELVGESAGPATAAGD